jgi:cytochrome c5
MIRPQMGGAEILVCPSMTFPNLDPPPNTAMKLTTSILSITCVVAFLNFSPAADPAPLATPATNENGVVSITLPAVDAPLPDAPGKQTITAACVMCHTTRYITMQPKVSRAAWTANVDKMRKVFGAPMSDAQAAEAVDYLVAIRGVDAPAAKPKP